MNVLELFVNIMYNVKIDYELQRKDCKTMKKRILLCALLCCFLLLPSLAACTGGTTPTDPTPSEPVDDPTVEVQKTLYTVDFADGKTDFLMLDTGTLGNDPQCGMELKTFDGENVLALTAPNGGAVRVGINVSGLLGERAADVSTIVFDIYAEFPDGRFSAVGGKLRAMSGDLEPIAEDDWLIYIDTRNPGQAVLELGENGFSSAGANLVEFSLITNGPVTRGEAAAEIYIQGITFFDSSYTGLSVNTSAGWEAPAGYGDPTPVAIWDLPNPSPRFENDWNIYYTLGVDGRSEEGVDDYLPWEIVNASYGIVLEMADDPEPDGVTFVAFGAYNSWAWGEGEDKNAGRFWDDGKLTILWQFVGFNPKLITEDNDAVKLQIGNWSEVPITAIYLIYDEDSVS